MSPDATTFEPDQRPTAATDFDYPVEDGIDPAPQECEADAVHFNVRLLVCRVLDILTSEGASAKVVGKRALALQYALNASSFRNQKELARQMGVTPARASQILTALEAEAARFLRGDSLLN